MERGREHLGRMAVLDVTGWKLSAAAGKFLVWVEEGAVRSGGISLLLSGAEGRSPRGSPLKGLIHADAQGHADPRGPQIVLGKVEWKQTLCECPQTRRSQLPMCCALRHGHQNELPSCSFIPERAEMLVAFRHQKGSQKENKQ